MASDKDEFKFEFTDTEKAYIKKWLHGLQTDHDISASSVIEHIEALLTERERGLQETVATVLDRR